jgi:hypothetical protein
MADLRGCPGAAHPQPVADTQVCPYALHYFFKDYQRRESMPTVG